MANQKQKEIKENEEDFIKEDEEILSKEEEEKIKERLKYYGYI